MDSLEIFVILVPPAIRLSHVMSVILTTTLHRLTVSLVQQSELIALSVLIPFLARPAL